VFSETFRHSRSGVINFAGCDELFAAARFAGQFLESVAREGLDPGINLNYKFHRTMARAEGGPPAVNANGSRGRLLSLAECGAH